MNALRVARAYGVAVSFADLGDWGASELRSEYDPREPAIRVNARAARRFSAQALREFVMLAVGHELYHHREAIGEVPTRSDRAERESAADRYARDLANAAR